MHIMKRLVDPTQILSMRDELVDLKLAALVIRNQLAHLRAALDAAKSTTFPYAACDELEG